MAAERVMYRRLRHKLVPSRMQSYNFSNKPCNFKGYRCPQMCIEGHLYCIRHILEDEKAPFQQCAFTYSFTMKRCPQAASKCDYESFCPEHYIKMQRARNRAGKAQPPTSVEKLLSSLGHFVKAPEQSGDDNGLSLDVSSKSVDSSSTKTLNPFIDIDANAVNNSLSSVLDYCSESDSDVDTSVIARTGWCKDEDSSDAESIDSAGEDMFKFATVFTAEEALQRAKEKTMKLRTLYADQLKHLQHVLRERRRDYLSAIQKEKESLCSIAEQSTSSVRDLKLAEKIKGYNHYRRFYGVEAILRKKMKDKRKGLAADAQTTRPGGTKCIFTEGGVKCNVRTLPHSKFCPKHILNDPFQVLFRPCGFEADDNICREPLPGMEPCIYHMGMVPAQISYNTALSSEEEDDAKEDPKLIKTESSEGGIKLESLQIAGSSHNVLVAGEIKLENGGVDMSSMELVDAEAFGFEEEIVVCDELV